MARLKIAYIGGGSTRGAGTMSSFVAQGENFAGSEIVLIDLSPDRLELIRTLSERMIAARGLDLRVSATTDRRAGLTDCDAVLTSYRVGGFEARALDERLPLAHDVIGQETQGPGGFFMALRSVHALKPMLADIASVCPKATIFNYTNPINLVAQAVADNTDANIVSVKHTYQGRDLIEILREAWEERRDDTGLSTLGRRMLRVAATMGSVPSAYFQYYYFEREILAELKAKATTRAEDILKDVPSYWAHYEDQAKSDNPALDPKRSRGGIHELELAIDCMGAIYNDREVLPVNVVNRGSVPGLADDLVVETLGRCGAGGVTALKMPALPRQARGLVNALGEYQSLAAKAAWSGDHRDAVRALVANPLVRSPDVAERLYGEMSVALRDHLPDRLVAA